MASTNPIAPKEFTYHNVTDALYATLKEGDSKYLTKDQAFNGYKTANGCNILGFRSNMSYTAPELVQLRFWNGNSTKWAGICELLRLFGGEQTPELFDAITAHYNWRKATVGKSSGFVPAKRLVLGNAQYALS